MLERLLCYKEVTKLLGVSVQRLREWKMQGRLPGIVKLGSLVRFPYSYVLELMTKGVPPFHAH
jgi:excisionase family DNA binding protein